MDSTRTVFFGSGPFALPILARLVDPGPRHRPTDALDAVPVDEVGETPAMGGTLAVRVDIIAVVTVPPRPAGRTGEPRPSPVASLADAYGIPVLTPSSLRDAPALQALRGLAADLIVLADYGRIMPPAVLEMPKHGALNLHPSLLPRHRGAAPVAAAILAGDASTGVTLMRMDQGLDTGPILAQRQIRLAGSEAAP
ncbi:MAG TPA: methionyl-tRNA formyltransferase, partial [Candidatus Limnocylindrales bacterium]|nr:methionyl-tRNA formyltransferase [Candidatus Limnocylindrales bacterium]